MDDARRAALANLPPKSRDLLHRVLSGDDEDRRVISSALRYRDEAGDELAATIELLTVYLEARRKIVRMLAEIDAAG